MFSHTLIPWPPMGLLFSPLSGAMVAQASITFSPYISPPWAWFCLGLGFMGAEGIWHHRLRHSWQYILLMMGLSAVLQAIVLWRLSHSLGIVWRYMMLQDGAASLQILYWMGLAFTGIIWVRPMFHFRRRSSIPQDMVGETLTTIEPGKIGRVIYEGCSWQACCENYQIPILPHQRVYVLRREGNLLFVAPEDLFQP